MCARNKGKKRGKIDLWILLCCFELLLLKHIIKYKPLNVCLLYFPPSQFGLKGPRGQELFTEIDEIEIEVEIDR